MTQFRLFYFVAPVINPSFLLGPSLMKLLAIPLSQQAGKWLVIPRRRESSHEKTPEKQVNCIVNKFAGFPPTRE
jgi:hypothetical protein